MDFNDKQIKIMETAEELFAEKGFSGTSVRDIADAADINVAMISYYFGSKEKMLESIFTFRSETTMLKLESMFKNTALTPMEKVNQMIDYYIDKFMNQQCFHKIMMREQVANHRHAISGLIQEYKKRNQALVKQLIAEGQKSGDFVKNVDIPLLMTTLVGTVSHLVTTQHFYKELNNLQSLTDEQFEKLIRKKLSAHIKFLFKAILTHEA
ncbi:TetR family transcriptional regulator [Ferruginibacter sp.]